MSSEDTNLGLADGVVGVAGPEERLGILVVHQPLHGADVGEQSKVILPVETHRVDGALCGVNKVICDFLSFFIVSF